MRDRNFWWRRLLELELAILAIGIPYDIWQTILMVCR